jgi:hypothetical protein
VLQPAFANAKNTDRAIVLVIPFTFHACLKHPRIRHQ